MGHDFALECRNTLLIFIIYFTPLGFTHHFTQFQLYWNYLSKFSLLSALVLNISMAVKSIRPCCYLDQQHDWKCDIALVTKALIVPEALLTKKAFEGKCQIV